jgi:hypothetical protein
VKEALLEHTREAVIDCSNCIEYKRYHARYISSDLVCCLVVGFSRWSLAELQKSC